MLIEHKDFPVVRLHYDRSDPDGLLGGFAALEVLLARAEPFVMIGHGANQQAQSHDERKQITLWMKRHREALRRFVLALVYAEPKPAERQAARAQADAYAKFWGYPMLITASLDAALAVARRLLAGEPAWTIDLVETHDPETSRP